MALSLFADILLAIGAVGAGLYCLVLSRRLTRFTDLEKGVGGAVAVLSVQVDEMTKALVAAQEASLVSAGELKEVTAKAEAASQRLGVLLSSMQPTVAEENARPRTVRRSRRAEAKTGEPA